MYGLSCTVATAGFGVPLVSSLNGGSVGGGDELLEDDDARAVRNDVGVIAFL